jgi:ABC-type uncharacterized transport system substrate-binding protein
MKKQVCVLALCAVLLTLCFPAQAQQQPKVPKIGLLGTRNLSDSGSGFEIFRRELRALGYVDGKNVIIEYRSAEGKIDRLPALADELVHLKVDVLVTPGGIDAITAKKATSTIPIVFVSVPDPVGSGLVDSLARPGGNITGLTSITAELVGKRMELLKEMVPKLSRVAVLWNPQDPTSVQSWKEGQLAARDLGLQLHSMEVKSSDKLESAFKEATKARSTAFVMAVGSFFGSYQKQIADLAAKHRLPAIYNREDWVDSGGLMSYGPDRTEPYRRAAVFVDKILMGAKPADLPVEQPTKFELIINLKAAKQIGLTIPPNVLARADRVIR